MSKKGLGRGLEALLASNVREESGLQVLEIPLSEITSNPDQPRKDFDQDSLMALADSLRLHGLLQPILVRPLDSGYRIVAGERRFRAAQLAGMERINCLVLECNEREMAEKALVENLQRTDLSPVEEGRAYAVLMKEYGLTQEQVAQAVGKGRATVANLLRVIELPPPLLVLLREGKLTLGHGKLLSGLGDSSVQVLVGRKAAEAGLSVRETEELIKKVTEGRGAKPGKGRPSEDWLRLEEALRACLQTKVKVKGSSERGKIEIEFFSADELNRLLELWQVNVE
ncbi:ParB-like nuclease domain protein [Acididesulfobacillus acetoxydans]|uniref:ParB-like nuclease domain protein n=1 Tax=Acididesulfobacillus acetoxydans TaxID=1561005 RepID=A0A8S0VVM7_9FIRM|nr:ParB/RepB/Spo0J family partition protein [Acididesulfobacillus acetoxydans]CAA7599813.1 ParB-like nuclease domain protein [Acididesulfobacillus acetoxydans]CEJ07379.1 Stage 0 sporulation protein J [Acididesulfobacillus acetoxydans]